jgi:hypothetical protein
MSSSSGSGTAPGGCVFYAVAVVAGPGGAVEVDARPSDAVNLAVVPLVHPVPLVPPAPSGVLSWKQHQWNIDAVIATSMEH